MRKKTILSLPTAVLVVLSALGFTSCSKDEPEASTEETQDVVPDDD